jgi:hypothetical protein
LQPASGECRTKYFFWGELSAEQSISPFWAYWSFRVILFLVPLPRYSQLSGLLAAKKPGFDYATLDISPVPFWEYSLLSFVSLAIAERHMDNPGGLMDFAVWGQIMSLSLAVATIARGCWLAYRGSKTKAPTDIPLDNLV